MSDTEFVQQLAGSGAANLLSAVVIFGLWFLRKKCRHSKCATHTQCCDIEINDDDSTDNENPKNFCGAGADFFLC